jgi:putative transcriptional regulator
VSKKRKKKNVNFERIVRGLGEVAAYGQGDLDPASYRAHVPEAVDVTAIRKALKLTQEAFAERFGFSVGAVRDWEQGRRRPEASARILLKVIEKHPEVIEDVLRDAA